MKRFPILHPVTGRVLASLSEQTIRTLNQGGALMPPTPEIVDPKRDHLDTAWAKDPGMAAKIPTVDGHPAQNVRPLLGAPENNRGRSVTLSENDPIGIIVQTPTNAGDDAEVITVVCGRELVNVDLDADSGTVVPPIVGLLEFGIGGSMFRTEFDWLNGTIINVPASFASLSARFEPIPPPGPNFNGGQLVLSGALSYGFTSRQSCPARLTRRLYAKEGEEDAGLGLEYILPGQASEEILMPDFATAFTLTSYSLDNLVSPDLNFVSSQTPLLVAQRGSDGVSVFEYETASNRGIQLESQFGVLNSMRKLSVRNMGLRPAAVRAVFTLTF